MSATDYIVCGILGGLALAAIWVLLVIAHDSWRAHRERGVWR